MNERSAKSQINRAGRVLRHFDEASPEALLNAVLVLDAWRAAHAKPLGSINANLRHYVRKHEAVDAQVSQRLKRLETIVGKLQREPTMALARMEDIGGVRAIVTTQAQIDAIVSDIRSQSRWQIQ